MHGDLLRVLVRGQVRHHPHLALVGKNDAEAALLAAEVVAAASAVRVQRLLLAVRVRGQVGDLAAHVALDDEEPIVGGCEVVVSHLAGGMHVQDEHVFTVVHAGGFHDGLEVGANDPKVAFGAANVGPFCDPFRSDFCCRHHLDSKANERKLRLADSTLTKELFATNCHKQGGKFIASHRRESANHELLSSRLLHQQTIDRFERKMNIFLSGKFKVRYLSKNQQHFSFNPSELRNRTLVISMGDVSKIYKTCNVVVAFSRACRI